MLKKSDPLCPIKCCGHDHGAGCKGPGAAAESASGRGELEPAQAAARAASAPPAAPTALAFSFPSFSLTLSGRFLVWAHRGRRFVFRTSAHQRGPPGSPVPLSSRTFPDELRPLHQGTHLLAETCPTSSPGAFPSSSHHTQPALALSFTPVRPKPATPTPGRGAEGSTRTHTHRCAHVPRQGAGAG